MKNFFMRLGLMLVEAMIILIGLPFLLVMGYYGLWFILALIGLAILVDAAAVVAIVLVDASFIMAIIAVFKTSMWGTIGSMWTWLWGWFWPGLVWLWPHFKSSFFPYLLSGLVVIVLYHLYLRVDQEIRILRIKSAD